VGIALADINRDGHLDLVLLAYATSYPAFRYRIGWGVQPDGSVTSWGSNYVGVPGFGTPTPPVRGAGIILADLDLDGTLDILLMAYTSDDDSGNGTFRYKIGWSLKTDGTSTRFSRDFYLRQHGPNAVGAGVGYGHLFSYRPSGMGTIVYRPHIFLASRVATTAGQELRVSALPLTTPGAAFGAAEDYLPPFPYTRPDVLSVPSSFDDETGEKLFNLNMREVQSTAWDAVSSFIAHCEGVLASGATAPECLYHSLPGGTNFVNVINGPGFSNEACPDCLVAAVAWYVDQNMGWTDDKINAYVLNDIFGLRYSPGGEGMPAYYTIHYTNPTTNANLITQLNDKDPDWAAAYNDGKLYHGDCEDFAILRHALLRALAFDRRFVWNVRVPGHEFNVVLYGGSYRVMDYGPIYWYLCAPKGGRINAAWNQDFGPRLGAQTPDYFKDLVLPRAYPDRCGADEALFTRFARPELDNRCDCCRP